MKKILLFLFVNGKCYGTQLHRALNTSLTPLQKALLRLEKGGIIMSYYEGKTRLYQFNPACPLLQELEQLLKKAYTLLPPQEKRIYTLGPQNTLTKGNRREEKAQVLLAFWQRLASVKEVVFQAKTKSKQENGWNGKGKGEVIVNRESDTVLTFTEKGTWKGDSHREIDFKNIFRWTLDLKAGMIALEHLRHGPNYPVFLFHLAPTENHTLASIDSHLCEGDTYFGQIFFDHQGLRLSWRVIGPKKNEELDYYYI